MSENFTANPGAGGDTFAADDVAGVKIPYSKLDIGGDGLSSPVTVANPMPTALSAAQIAALAPLATQPISANALPLPTGAATETTIAALNAKVPALSGGRIPVELPPGSSGLTDAELRADPVPVTQVNPIFWRVGFAEVGSGLRGLAATELTLLKTGSGMAVNQSGGNLVITTGTTVNAETVFRSVDTFRGAMLARYQMILSQRIANQVFRVELADLIGDGLAYTINSATSVTVTIPGTTFTSESVGQFMRLAVLSSVGIPGRYAIASVSGDDVTFTVSGWPATGSGTLTLYGHNWIASEYSGTTATNTLVDAQRRGWASGNTAATINTTASPGHVGQIAFDVMSMGYADALAASNIGFQWTPRASRIANIPDEYVNLYVFLVVQNGSVAPASTTTATIGFLSVEDQPRNKVRMSGADPSTSNATPVQIMGGNALATQPVSGGVTATLAASTVRAGFIAGAAIWYDDSSTVLASAATFTGTSRDLTVTATATAMANAATYAKELRLSAESDQSGTLWLETSRDGTNWRRVKSVATAAVTGGGQFAEIIHRPSWRYARVGFTNGATLQTRFTINSIMIGA